MNLIHTPLFLLCYLEEDGFEDLLVVVYFERTDRDKGVEEEMCSYEHVCALAGCF